VFNNSGECIIDCEVIRQKEILITRLINYPNPFSGSTRFLFNLDGPYAGAQAQIDIFTFSGQLVKKLAKAINEVDGRSIEIEWNGRDDSGDALGRGIYIFRLIIKGREGQVSKKIQKLIIL
jgi:flagellar hook assembly protein FlgD